jgi:hypothetical protein
MLYKENPLIKGINQDKLILIKAELYTRNILIIKNHINACDNSIDLVQAEVFSHTYLLLYQLKRKLQLLLNWGISFAACWFRANGYDGSVSRRSL